MVWLAWAPSGPPRPEAARDANELLAQAVYQTRHCVGFSPDAAWLPSDLVQAADSRLSLPKMTSDDVVYLAAELCGAGPAARLSGEDAAMLTPRLLRLARRPDQSPNAYVAKLVELLAHDRAAALHFAAASPRDEPTLDRLYGMDEAVAWGRDLARDLAAYQQGKLAWASVDKGCLLSGPPGTGKTLFARALAASCGVPLVSGSYARWHGTGSAHQGDLLKAMAKSFAEARSKAPSVLFIDEIDSFSNRSAIRHHYVEWETQVVNGLLAEIDGVQGREGVVVIGACNHPDRLDPALIRSGRLDRHIRIRLPDGPALEHILREHLGADLPNMKLAPVALMAAGMSGADCERLVRGARRRARTGSRPMTPDDLLAEVIDDQGCSPQALRLAAVHEAGHAVAACVLRPGVLQAVALRSRGDEAGLTTTRWSAGAARPKDIRDRLVFLLAGRAAEQLLFGEPSSGAGGSAESDLAMATRLAAQSVTCLGFDAHAGLVWSGDPGIALLPGMLAQDRELRERVRQALNHAYTDALALIQDQCAAVEAVASTLVEQRAIDGAAVEALVVCHAHPV